MEQRLIKMGNPARAVSKPEKFLVGTLATAT
jgi:hypothetical protein